MNINIEYLKMKANIKRKALSLVSFMLCLPVAQLDSSSHLPQWKVGICYLLFLVWVKVAVHRWSLQARSHQLSLWVLSLKQLGASCTFFLGNRGALEVRWGHLNAPNKFTLDIYRGFYQN